MHSDDGNPLITVVIPAYNAEATIERALNSVLSQSIRDWEIVAVNDGSTDSTASLLRAWCGKIPQLRIMTHTANRGLAAAARTGVLAARGAYITRLDADDTLPNEALERLATGLAGIPDMVVAGHWRIEPDGRRQLRLPAKRPGDINSLEIRVDNFSMCWRLIRRQLLQKALPWEGLDCWEDLGVAARVMAMAETVVRVAEPAYNYYIAPRGESLSTARRERLLADHLVVARRVETWMEEQGLQRRFRPFLNRLKLCAKVKFLRGRGKDVKGWKATFPEVNSRVLFISHVPFAARMAFAVVAMLPTSVGQWIADCCDVFYSR